MSSLPLVYEFTGSDQIPACRVVPVETLDIIAGTRQTPGVIMNVLMLDLPGLAAQDKYPELTQFGDILIGSEEIQAACGSRRSLFLRIGEPLKLFLADAYGVSLHLRLSERDWEILRLLNKQLIESGAFTDKLADRP